MNDKKIKFFKACEDAILLQDKTKLHNYKKQIEQFLNSNSEKDKFSYTFALSNICSCLSQIENEKFDSWKFNQTPEFAISSLNHLRKICSFAKLTNHPTLDDFETNLGNQLGWFGRGFESLTYWSCNENSLGDAFQVSSSSKGKMILWLSKYLNDPGHIYWYFLYAYKIFSNLKRNESLIDHPGVLNTLNNSTEIKWLLTEFSGEDFDSEIIKFNKIPKNKKEKKYVDWCLKNKLFLNPINEITSEWMAGQDILQFPDHIVRAGEGPYFSASFSAIKREYCFSRFLLFQGTSSIFPTYENKNNFLTDTLDGIDYSSDVEAMKTSLRISYSCLDKIAVLLNQYFELGTNINYVSFKVEWLKKLKKIKENPFLNSIFWVSCDFSKNNKMQLSPDSKFLWELRNAMEHKWVRVSENNETPWLKEKDYALVINKRTLQAQTLKMLNIVKYTMLYLTCAIKFNEDKIRETEKSFLKFDTPTTNSHHS